jgi:hypothetical protein
MAAGKRFYTEDAEGTEIAECKKFTDLFYWCSARSTLHAELTLSAEPARRSISMTLRQLVDLYLSVAGQFSQSVSLSSLQLSTAETERLFSSCDEDYHISRFFHFYEAEGEKFSINGIAATHVSIDSEIDSIL